MGELFRSQEIQLIQLFIQFDAAHDTVEELGNLGRVQFRDLNSEDTAFQRNFVNDVKRCDEMEDRLITILNELAREKKEGADFIVEDSGLDNKPITMDALEQRLELEERELVGENSNTEQLERRKNELTELKHVLEKDSTFFHEAGDIRGESNLEGESINLISGEKGKDDDFETPYPKMGFNLGFITGVIQEDKFLAFERVLWRATRGNLFMRSEQIHDYIIDPHTREEVTKVVFIIFFQGQRIQNKIKKICEAFKANIYQCPESANERNELLREIKTQLKNLEIVIEKGKEHRLKILRRCGSEIRNWEVKVATEKSIYHTMNLFNYDHGRRCLIAEGWCPKECINEVQYALRKATERSGSVVPSILSIIQPNETPPTYFKVNKYTAAYQDIVDAYGIPHYGEINPTVFTIMTFPFLFAVMYGDIGHGILILLFAIALLANEKKLAKVKMNEILQMMFDGRYVLLMMAIGTLYTGLLYNEFFAIPMNIFGSKWEKCTGPYLCPNPNKPTYPFGVDPAWKGSKNELIFLNSLKMKLSVIIGVIQMMMGIFMHCLNAIHFKKWYNIFFEFIPQTLFMLSIFGYMDFLIILKWVKPWPDPSKAPNIINVLIQMFLQPTSPDAINLNLLGSVQKPIQIVLVIIAGICIPIMLLPKPLLLRRDAMRGHHDPEHGDHFEFGEVFIHQLIHTIEFVLGSISNTASYLRLWALSLAHAELSIVFWEKIMVAMLGLSDGSSAGFVYMYVGFAVWAAFTVGVLLIMESLSAFLHALRLHWVEFQNKFYLGDGRKFAPYRFNDLVLANSFIQV
eukprot:TRINITY_DN1638_c0_g3_i1.p1 TRINITY_DN1638_c0_g3~~TRINITY_DN1638_c0_g3_i1.p1  ORF type:complete len:802 (-),score=235.14 TRINITY_DN1638_c0_g3_i1:43-2448(-)